MSKESLRQELKHSRLSLPTAEVDRASGIICQKAYEAFEWSGVESVHCYTSINELNEVETSGLLAVLVHKTNVYTSRKVAGEWKQGKMEGARFTPVNDAELPVFNVIFVPCLGFDKNKHRIGYGGGWYDRFLSSQDEAIKVGLCFEAGRLDAITPEPHDIPLDKIITEA